MAAVWVMLTHGVPVAVEIAFPLPSFAIDPERAPFVTLAFELYATGEYTMDEVVDELNLRGFTTRPTVSRPAGPVSTSKMSRLLRDAYYLGGITYQGDTFEGRHPAIVDRDLFNRVQELLEATGRAGERKRIYEHYLKGSLWCGECHLERRVDDSRMLIQRAVGRNKVDYFYFFCAARQQGACDSRHLPIGDVEGAVVEHYRTVQLNAEFIDWVEKAIDKTLEDQKGAQRLLRNELTTRLNQLSVKADNLIDLVAEGGLASSRAASKIREIQVEKEHVGQQLGSIEDDLAEAVMYIRGWLKLLTDPRAL